MTASPGSRSTAPTAHDRLMFADDLCAFIDASPSPFHAVATAAGRLGNAGFEEVDARGGAWPASARDSVTRAFVRKGGSLIAWVVPEELEADAGFRIAGAHTDSPNLRVKENPDAGLAGWRQLLVDPYGGALVASWMDRDLGLSGRVVTRGTGGGVAEHLVLVDEPVLRVPELAIHLDRSVHTDGVKPDPQRHLNPVWGIGDVEAGDFRGWLAELADVDPDAMLGFDLMTHDVTPSGRIGVERDMVSAPRLDNLCSTHAGIAALLAAAESPGPHVQALVLFDHEEVGSTSERGAASTWLTQVLERVTLTAGLDRDDFLRMLAASVCASSDMAHCTHPNYADRHEPHHWITPGGGPVLKVNHNLRYATDGAGAAVFDLACEQAGVPLQRYVHRADLPCGSTIGPVTSAELGITTVDVGAPQLSMHSVRELMSADDPAQLSLALGAFLAPA